MFMEVVVLDVPPLGTVTAMIIAKKPFLDGVFVSGSEAFSLSVTYVTSLGGQAYSIKQAVQTHMR